MRVSIGFSGAAGTGVNTSGLLLGELLSAKGYTILGDKEYASIIKGDNNDFFLYISDPAKDGASSDYFITQKIDFFFAFDDWAVAKNEKIYNLKKVYNVKNQDVKYKNVFCFGAALKLFGIAINEGKKKLEENFSGDALALNIEILEKGYNYIKAPSHLSLAASVGSPKEFKFGNEIVGKGAMGSGLDFYAAYPMTPASSIIDVVVDGFQKINKGISDDNPQKSSKSSGIFFQGEDEIAVSMAMLGARFAGKRSMCGTSGGGFALMTESISFSNQAEIGGVYVLSQRDGPSTGTPTFTGQADLNYALNASFGDTYPIVLAPATYQEGYNMIGKALNWADIYQHPVIFLIDKQFSESYLSVDPNTLKAEPISRGKLKVESGKFEGDYLRYKLTEDGISPVVLPGTENGEFIATSYEHRESGATTEEPNEKKAMMEKRFRKLDTFIQQEFNENFFGYDIINPEAKIFFVTMGFNRYVLEDYIKLRNLKKAGKIGKGGQNSSDLSDNLSDFGLIVIKVMQPFDMRLKEFLDSHIKQIKKLIFVEINFSGQMQELVTNKCLLNDKKWIKKISNIRKYSLYPFFLEEIKSL